MEESSAESNVLEKRILELERMAAANSLDDGAFDRLQQILSTFCRSVEEMTVEQKRAALRELVHKVIWDGGHAHVVFWGADAEEISFAEIPGDG
jgi:site-specific DNA recombinase